MLSNRSKPLIWWALIYIWVTPIITTSHLHSYSLWQFATFLTNPDWNWLIIMYIALQSNSAWMVWLCLLVNSELFQFTDLGVVDKVVLTPTLLNGLFLIHPICTSFVFYGLIRQVATPQIFYFNNTARFPYLRLASPVHLNILLLTGIVGIFLGGWWAYQELGWGGWWSWDPVEIVNLILVILCLQTAHTSRFVRSATIRTKQSICWILIISHLMIRLDLFNSVHSFAATQITCWSMIWMWLFLNLLVPTSTKPNLTSLVRVDQLILGSLFVGLCSSLAIDALWGYKLSRWWWWIVTFGYLIDMSVNPFRYWNWAWVLLIVHPYFLILYATYIYFTSSRFILQLMHAWVVVIIAQLYFNCWAFFYIPDAGYGKSSVSWTDWVVSLNHNTSSLTYQQFVLTTQDAYSATNIFSYMYILASPFIYVPEVGHMEILYHFYNWYFIILLLCLWNFKNIISYIYTKYKKWCMI